MGNFKRWRVGSMDLRRTQLVMVIITTYNIRILPPFRNTGPGSQSCTHLYLDTAGFWPLWLQLSASLHQTHLSFLLLLLDNFKRQQLRHHWNQFQRSLNLLEKHGNLARELTAKAKNSAWREFIVPPFKRSVLLSTNVLQHRFKVCSIGWFKYSNPPLPPPATVTYVTKCNSDNKNLGFVLDRARVEGLWDICRPPYWVGVVEVEAVHPINQLTNNNYHVHPPPPHWSKLSLHE